MSSFEEILARALKGRPGIKLPATTEVQLEQKGLDLAGTLEVRMRGEGEVAEEDIEEQASLAAVRRIEDIIDGVLSQDIFDARMFTKTTRTKKRGTVEVSSSISALRGRDGKFLSPTSLARVLNLTLFSYVQEFMKEPALVNRTGRFAHSANITSVTLNKKLGTQRKNRGSIFFSYMLFPYQVFESNPRRDPRKLITKAISQALRKVLSPDSFKKNIFNIGMEK